jgi:H+/Cl- antiporter ClcA
MSQESLVMIMGAVVFATPFLGIPNDWKYWIFIVLGALTTIIGYRLRRAQYLRSLTTPEGERRGDAFVENPTPLRASGEETR